MEKRQKLWCELHPQNKYSPNFSQVKHSTLSNSGEKDVCTCIFDTQTLNYDGFAYIFKVS